MKKLKALLLSTAMFLTSYSQAQLSGTYSIDPSGNGDYTTLTGAMNDAETQGISANVKFELEPGSYAAQNIGVIPGSSSTKKLRIVANSSGVNDVVLAQATLNQTEHIVFNGLYFIGSVQISNASDIGIKSCTFDTPSSSILFFLGHMANIRILDCEFQRSDPVNSGDALHGANGSQLGEILISGNRVTGSYHRAILIDQAEQIEIIDNYINLSGTDPSEQPIFISNSIGNVHLLRNTVIGPMTNAVDIQGWAVYIDADPAFATSVNCVNNMISSRNKALKVSRFSDATIQNNSLNSNKGIGLVVYDCTADIRNNAIRSYVHGIWFVNDHDVTSMDNNVIWNWDTQAIVRNNQISYALPAWAASTGFDQNSMTADPKFNSNTDLHLKAASPCIDAGQTLSSFSDDIDWGTRVNAYDVGADERGVTKSMEYSKPSRHSSFELSAHPVPSNGPVKIRGNFAPNANYKLTDIQGRIVGIGQIGDGALDLSAHPIGCYFLILVDNDRSGSIRLQLQ